MLYPRIPVAASVTQLLGTQVSRKLCGRCSSLEGVRVLRMLTWPTSHPPRESTLLSSSPQGQDEGDVVMFKGRAAWVGLISMFSTGEARGASSLLRVC